MMFEFGEYYFVKWKF